MRWRAKLVEWVREHFDSQERLMEAHGYPRSAFLEHRQQHKKFREYMDTLQSDIHENEVSPMRLAFRCQFLLLDWFVSHINIADRHLVRHLST